MRSEIRISGQGGQGVITLGLIFGRASALYDNKNVIMTEAYGPEQTGGFAQTDLIISDEEIEYPMVNTPDILVVMSKEGWVMNGTRIGSNSMIIYEDFMVKLGDNTNEKYGIPALAKANEMGKKVVMNVIMMGALQEITKLVSKEALEKALLERVPKGTEELNLQALRAGYELARGIGGN